MISDFQMALVGIAVVVVIAVIVYNRWQESKYKRRAERAFSADHPDVLFGASRERGEHGEHADRVEPQLGSMPAARLHDDVEEGLLSPIVSEPIFPRSADDSNGPAINGEIDTVALVLADAPMLPDQFWPTLRQSRQVSKHILWEGLVAGLWQPISENSDDDTGYRELRAGLQLASRSGAVDANMLQSFNEMMAAFAHGIGAVSQREDVAAATARAQSVDALCADTDIEIAVNLIGKSGVTFATTKVRGLAESHGMVAIPSGEYVLHDELNHVLFTLRNMNPEEPAGIKMAGTYLTGLCFALDVPRTPHPEKTFEKMMTLALRFADALQGEVVDDNRKLLTANGRKSISDTIVQIAADMQARGIVPGSSAALRLYS
ncbi:MAG: cell division protein ZipA C-terminal FtsZ-binding domain-containing protein [Betaproteobacteria bacterium]